MIVTCRVRVRVRVLPLLKLKRDVDRRSMLSSRARRFIDLKVSHHYYHYCIKRPKAPIPFIPSLPILRLHLRNLLPARFASA